MAAYNCTVDVGANARPNMSETYLSQAGNSLKLQIYSFWYPSLGIALKCLNFFSGRANSNLSDNEYVAFGSNP